MFSQSQVRGEQQCWSGQALPSLLVWNSSQFFLWISPIQFLITSMYRSVHTTFLSFFLGVHFRRCKIATTSLLQFYKFLRNHRRSRSPDNVSRTRGGTALKVNHGWLRRNGRCVIVQSSSVTLILRRETTSFFLQEFFLVEFTPGNNQLAGWARGLRCRVGLSCWRRRSRDLEMLIPQTLMEFNFGQPSATANRPVSVTCRQHHRLMHCN